MLSRREALCELLKCIFDRTTISLVGEDVVYKGRWFSECNYDETSFGNYCRLFHHVLSHEYVEVIDKNRQSEKIDAEKIRRRIIQYFINHDTDISEVCKWSNCVNEQNKFLLDAIIVILREIILSWNTVSRTDKELEDISKTLPDALDKVSSLASSYLFRNTDLIGQTSDFNSQALYDSQFSKEKCNYMAGVCVENEKLLRKAYAIHPIIVGMRYLFHCQEHDKSFDRMYLDFLTGSIEKCNSNNKKICFHDFKIRLAVEQPSYDFLMQRYTFFTYIDETVIFQNELVTQESVEKMIKQRAEQELTSCMLEKYTTYCNEVFVYIDTILSNITSLDFREILTISNYSADKGKMELQKIVVNFGKFFLDMNDDKDIFFLIQSVVYTATIMFEKQGSIFVEEFKENIPEEELKKHLAKVKRNLKKMSDITDFELSLANKNPNEFKEPESINDLYTYHIRGLIGRFSDAVNGYISRFGNNL
ncbi:MAG TPA: hypothetical protein DCO72_06230 [Ruminococcus sp.]|nr:hypothetical protein [Ruminococcus sp.]